MHAPGKTLTGRTTARPLCRYTNLAVAGGTVRPGADGCRKCRCPHVNHNVALVSRLIPCTGVPECALLAKPRLGA